MAADNPGRTYLAIDGAEDCIRALEDALDGKLSGRFIEMSACERSCIGGPRDGQEPPNPRARASSAVTRYAGKERSIPAHAVPFHAIKRIWEMTPPPARSVAATFDATVSIAIPPQTAARIF
jgi:iron only hydrogenase large subunit-like protein